VQDYVSSDDMLKIDGMLFGKGLGGINNPPDGSGVRVHLAVYMLAPACSLLYHHRLVCIRFQLGGRKAEAFYTLSTKWLPRCPLTKPPPPPKSRLGYEGGAALPANKVSHQKPPALRLWMVVWAQMLS
jgi:hypothetical protein